MLSVPRKPIVMNAGIAGYRARLSGRNAAAASMHAASLLAASFLFLSAAATAFVSSPEPVPVLACRLLRFRTPPAILNARLLLRALVSYALTGTMVSSSEIHTMCLHHILFASQCMLEADLKKKFQEVTGKSGDGTARRLTLPLRHLPR